MPRYRYGDRTARVCMQRDWVLLAGEVEVGGVGTDSRRHWMPPMTNGSCVLPFEIIESLRSVRFASSTLVVSCQRAHSAREVEEVLATESLQNLSGYRIGRRVLITRRYAATVVDEMGVIATYGERDFVGLGGGLRSNSGRESDGIPLAEHVTQRKQRRRKFAMVMVVHMSIASIVIRPMCDCLTTK